MAKPSESDDWEERRASIVGLGERSFHKSYYPQLRQNLERLERFHTLLDQTTDFVILTELAEGRVTDANAALGRLLGQPLAALIGQPLSALGLGDTETMLQVLRDEIALDVADDERPSHSVTIKFTARPAVSPDLPRYLEFSYRVASVDHHPYGVMVGRDVTERVLAEDRANYLSSHDTLTALPNQALLQDRLQQAIAYAERSETSLALIMLDIDRFKAINDFLGHAAGDRLLVEVSQRLLSKVRAMDTVGRKGGDEFLILLTDLAEPDAVATFLGNLLAQFHEKIVIDAQELAVTASLGVAIYPEDGSDFGTLLRKADIAMYRAKEAGGNSYRFFNEEMNDSVIEHMTLYSGLQQALVEGQFILYYQPQIDIATGRMVGAEALIRWRHPDLGLVSPARFIPVAEETGLIVPIGDWVLREACREAAKWQRAGWQQPLVAVNLSALQFKRGDIERSVIDALEAAGLEPQMLELELTESILISDTENVLATVKRLKAMGVRLSIDDFGTGYSSLSYLRRFEVDKLKVDQSFVRDLGSHPEDDVIVRTIIQMAHSLGLRTIAEGVETREELGLLKDFQCDETQGYFHGRPMPSEGFMAFFAAQLSSHLAL